MTGRDSIPWRAIATAILIAGTGAMLALNFPGQMSWDSVAQLADGRSGAYNSWHPPVMAFLLGLFDQLLPGTGLFLLFQTALILAALLTLIWLQPRSGSGTAIAALIVVLTPQWLLFQGDIWKDIIFANAAIAGFASLALAQRRWRARWIMLAVLLFTLAIAARQNALALAPVMAATVGMIARRHGRDGWRWGSSVLAATVLLPLAVTLALAARGDRGEGAAAQIRLAQVYDLTAAFTHAPVLALPLADQAPTLAHLLKTRGPALYTPLRNDPLMADPAMVAAIAATPPATVAQSWQALILHHPWLYLRARADAFRAVVTTPDSQTCHFAPVGISGDPTQLAALGLTARIRPQDQAVASYASHFFRTPLYAHLFWIAGAVMLLWLAIQRGDIAMAGLLSAALLFVITFVIVSVACDYRYLLFLDLAVLAAGLRASGGAVRMTKF